MDDETSTGAARLVSRRTFGLGGAAAVALVAAGRSAATASPPAKDPDQGSATSSRSTNGLPTSPPAPAPLLRKQQVDKAVRALDDVIGDAMRQTRIPGLATAVVYQDRVVYARGFGVRQVGTRDAVDADTVFQLASVSKPLASTVVAGVLGRKKIPWEDPVKKYNPAFALKDPYVTQNATFADLLSHVSGLKHSAGDLLEDLYYDRDYILSHLVQEPLNPFRSTYLYNNFGYTMGGVAAAAAAGVPWEQLAEDVLFRPLGMATASYRHSDFLARPNRARLHVDVGTPGNRAWEAKYDREPDAEAPAGGASASLNDLTRWVRLHLGNGSFGGRPVIDADALHQTWWPYHRTQPVNPPTARAAFYGLGWNVNYDEQGRLRIGHSGAFFLGAATNVSLIPVENLGIITLTNAQPIGVAEAVNVAFLDIAQNGKPTVDWLTFLQNAFSHLGDEDKPAVDYTKPPSVVTPARSLGAYAGTYQNSYYGPLAVTATGGGLSMTLGPSGRPTVFPLTHYTGDTFTFQTVGENANGLAGAIFHANGGTIGSVTLDFYDRTGLGTFVR